MADDTRETWRNVSGSQVYAKFYGQRGEITDLHIPPGGTGVLTTESRRLNQDKARSDDLDVFQNGMLIPVSGTVKLIEDDVEYASLADSPNVLSESDLRGLFDLTPAKFKGRLAEITGVSVVLRLAELAADESDKGVKATMAQVKAIEARREELDTRPKRVKSENSDI